MYYAVDVPITPTTIITTDTNRAGALSLHVDTNGDGVIDSIVPLQRLGDLFCDNCEKLVADCECYGDTTVPPTTIEPTVTSEPPIMSVFSGETVATDETKIFFKNYEIESMRDIENLRAVFTQNEKTLQSLRDELSENNTKLGAYQKILEIHDDMKYGSYIDKLIHEEREHMKTTEYQRNEVDDLE